jgi:RNA polymerase sigma factor (sigma-70 family)
MYAENIQHRNSPAPRGADQSNESATIAVGGGQPREHQLALEVSQCLSDLLRAAADKPEVWEMAINSLAPHRPTQARRTFRHFMSWNDDQRSQAMAALEGAIDWAKDGRGELLLDTIEELELSPRFAHALVACWPASDHDAIKAPYSRWRNAVNELVSKYHRLAFKLANQFQARVGGDEDWVSQAFLALIKAAEMYDASKAEFITFAYSWIQFELKKAYEHESEHQKLIPSSPDTHNETRNPENGEEESFVGLVPGPNQQFVAINRAKEVSAAINALTERERVVIRRLYGLNEREEVITADEISRDLGVTRARVYQIKAQALTKMQQVAA